MLDFGEYRADTLAKVLLRGDEVLPLPPKAFEVLLVLLESGGNPLTREQLMAAVWGETFVEEANLTQAISVLRKALGDEAQRPRYILTLPRRGYRFAAEVTSVNTQPSGKAKHRWRWSAAAALAGLLMAGAVLLGIRLTEQKTAPIRSIAVLPLRNLSGDPNQEYFSDGITEALISSLAQIHSLDVISRTSIMHYKGAAKTAPQIGRELSVDAIIEGSVQRSGGRVRIFAQLIRTSTDRHIWANEYERDASDVLKLEAEVARSIAREIQAKVTLQETRLLSAARTIAPEAHEQYLLARHLEDKRDETHLKQAIQHFEAAIQLEPNFASAYAGLAGAWVQRGVLGEFGFRESEVPARKAAIRAIELGPNLSEAHEVLAHVLMFYDMAWVTAEQEYRRAIELEPGNVYAHVYYATLLEIFGRFPEAIAAGQRSLALDPLSVTVSSEFGRVLFRARRYDDAIRQFQRTLELDSQEYVTHRRLADVYLQTGRFQEALSLGPTSRLQTARAYALLGRRADALKILGNVPEKPDLRRLDFALAYFALGDRDRGFEFLTRAFDDRQYVNLVACDPRWDIVRQDPRFRALVRRLGLPDTLREASK